MNKGDAMKTKRCTACHELLPTICFAAYGNHDQWLRSECRACYREESKGFPSSVAARNRKTLKKGFSPCFPDPA